MWLQFLSAEYLFTLVVEFVKCVDIQLSCVCENFLFAEVLRLGSFKPRRTASQIN